MRNTIALTVLGDGTTLVFQTLKRYTVASRTHDRVITKPLAAGFLVAVNGVLQTVSTDYTLDPDTGLVTFVVAPGNGLTVTWGGEFYIPVHYIAESFPVDFEAFNVQALDGLDLREERV